MQIEIWCADYFNKKGQLKIQQMAFVLVALMVFFVLVALVYFSIRLSNLENTASELGDERAKGELRALSGSAEFAYTPDDCAGCIDLDKVLILKESSAYDGFWNFDYLKIEALGRDGECTKFNYPDCGSITLIESEDFGSTVSSFVSLCRWEESFEGYVKCELGRVVASGGALNG